MPMKKEGNACQPTTEKLWSGKKGSKNVTRSKLSNVRNPGKDCILLARATQIRFYQHWKHRKRKAPHSLLMASFYQQQHKQYSSDLIAQQSYCFTAFLTVLFSVHFTKAWAGTWIHGGQLPPVLLWRAWFWAWGTTPNFIWQLAPWYN